MERSYSREDGTLEEVADAIQVFEQQTGYELGFDRDGDRFVYREERQNGLEAEIGEEEAWYRVNGCITDSLNHRDLPEISFMENTLRLAGFEPQIESIDPDAPYL